MSGWDVAVFPLAEERFSIVLVNEQGHMVKAPDLGGNRQGYGAAEAFEALRHRYGVPGEAARALIATAESKRLQAP